jgi:murein DD-endopeptidase MepM/ murein hydrolase activator NlpD
MGTPVVATADGAVVYAGRNEGGYGRIVKIEHGRGLETWYGHLHAIGVKMGKWVKRGDRIGKLGQSGRTTGPNLHYEVHINGKPVNPAKYLP